jgi:hypothetical protein
MPATSENAVALLFSRGCRDPLGVMQAMSAALSLQTVTVRRGAMLQPGTLAIVEDGTAVSLPLGPPDGSLAIVVSVAPSSTSLVSPAEGDTLNERTEPMVVGQQARSFRYDTSAKNWSVLT